MLSALWEPLLASGVVHPRCLPEVLKRCCAHARGRLSSRLFPVFLGYRPVVFPLLNFFLPQPLPLTRGFGFWAFAKSESPSNEIALKL